MRIEKYHKFHKAQDRTVSYFKSKIMLLLLLFKVI